MPLPAELAPYVKQLSYFLSYFPDKLVGEGLMHELQALRDELRRRLLLSSGALGAPDARDVPSRGNWTLKPDGAEWGQPLLGPP